MNDNDADSWAVRLAMDDISAAEEARLADWLRDDRKRQAALLYAKVRFAFVERAQTLLPPRAPRSGLSRRRALAWGTSALAAGFAGYWLLPAGERLSTAVGEVKRTRLADRSTVTLNTQTQVTVDLEPNVRAVSLDDGEAWFQVAHDRRRPFVVSAADLRVRAVGTAFSVRRMADGVNVLVTDGTVEIWRADRPDHFVRVSRDHRVFVPDDSLTIAPVSAPDGIERALAWRTGYLSLAGEALSYGVAELNRYNRVQLRIDDPVLALAPIYGFFEVRDPEAFAQMVAASQHARVEHDGDVLRLLPRSS